MEFATSSTAIDVVHRGPFEAGTQRSGRGFAHVDLAAPSTRNQRLLPSTKRPSLPQGFPTYSCKCQFSPTTGSTLPWTSAVYTKRAGCLWHLAEKEFATTPVKRTSFAIFCNLFSKISSRSTSSTHRPYLQFTLNPFLKMNMPKPNLGLLK